MCAFVTAYLQCVFSIYLCLVREKAKQLVALLKDDRKLKEERAKAHQARERQQALSSDSPNPRSSPNPGKRYCMNQRVYKASA